MDPFRLSQFGPSSSPSRPWNVWKVPPTRPLSQSIREPTSPFSCRWFPSLPRSFFFLRTSCFYFRYVAHAAVDSWCLSDLAIFSDPNPDSLPHLLFFARSNDEMKYFPQLSFPNDLLFASDAVALPPFRLPSLSKWTLSSRPPPHNFDFSPITEHILFSFPSVFCLFFRILSAPSCFFIRIGSAGSSPLLSSGWMTSPFDSKAVPLGLLGISFVVVLCVGYVPAGGCFSARCWPIGPRSTRSSCVYPFVYSIRRLPSAPLPQIWKPFRTSYRWT